MNFSFTRIPFLILTIPLTVGILFQHFSGSKFIYLFIGLIIVLILILFFSYQKSQDKKILILFIAFFCLIGSIRYSVWELGNMEKEYLAKLPLKNVNIEGTIESVKKSNRLNAIIALSKISNDSIVAEASGSILVYFPAKYSGNISPGQTASFMNTMLEKLPEPRNPGQFNYGKYLRRRGIVAQCRIEDKNQIILGNVQAGFSLENSIFTPVRSYLIKKLEIYFSPSASGFLEALLLGQRDSVDKDTIENFQDAGVMHVLAISGLHVGFVALIFYVVLSFFPFYFKHRNLLIIILLLFYMFLTGSQPPVVRATLMAMFVLISINIERRTSIYNSVFAAAFMILLFQPQQLFWVGFQFSFIAFLSIIYFYEKLKWTRTELLQRFKNRKIGGFMDKAILVPFLVSFSAQIGTLPLTMHYFHKLSLIAFFLNILVIPFIGLLVALGFLFFIIEFMSSGFAFIFANFLGELVKLLFNSIETSIHFPAAFFYIPKFSILSILLYGSVIFLLFNFKREKIRKSGLVFSILLVLFLMIKSVSSAHFFNLVIMDVGQGDAAFLMTPQNKTILIDTGPSSQYTSSARNAILPVLSHFNVNHVNYLFISHPHLDHMGGTFDMLKYIQVDTLYIPPMKQSYKWNDSLLSAISKNSISWRKLKMGDKVVIDNETRAYVLSPISKFSNFKRTSGHNLNNNSLVFLIKYRQHTLLFPGDAEREVENYLVAWQDILKTEFLKVGHHGSNTSTTRNFLELTQPQYASISVGQNNHFGHPSQSVIEELKDKQVQVFRTDEDKAIWFQLRRGKWERINWN
jgi:competence protein ComEC